MSEYKTIWKNMTQNDSFVELGNEEINDNEFYRDACGCPEEFRLRRIKRWRDITVKGPKVRMGYNYTGYASDNGNKYFRKTLLFVQIVFNTETGNVYLRRAHFTRRGHLKRGRWIRMIKKNPFRTTNNKFVAFRKMKGYKILREILGVDTEIDNEKFKVDKDRNPYEYDHYYETLTYRMMVDWFIKIRNITGLPDNYYTAFEFYPGLKYCRKYNLIEGMLKRNNCYDKRTNGLLHQTDDAWEMGSILSWKKVFKDAFYLIDLSTMKSKNMRVDYVPTHNSRFKLANLIKKYGDQIVSAVYDHLQLMKSYWNATGEHWEVKGCKTANSFQKEHSKLSRVLRRMESSDFELKFNPPEIVDKIEKKLNKNWKPKVLQTRDDYLDEGEHQDNCVFGYRKRIGECFIVSIRNEDERITCSVDYNGNIEQAKAAHNRAPDKDIVRKLQERLDKIKFRNLKIKRK